MALAYVGVGVGLWAAQDRFVFPAPDGVDTPTLDAAAAEAGAEPIALTTADGTRLYAWHAEAGEGRLVMFFHGNAMGLQRYPDLFRALTARGFDVLAVSYRGYPGSEGTPSQEGLGMDAVAAWGWSVGPGGYDPDRIVIHGRSLGGGVAAMLAAGEVAPAGLVLESTFGALRAVVADVWPIYPIRWMLRSPFDTLSVADRLAMPALILHSRDDERIPIDLGGRALASALPHARYEETEGYGHGACLSVEDPPSQRAYFAFLDRVLPPR